MADGKTEVLPGLSKSGFWSSLVNRLYSDDAYFFNGGNGNVYYDYRYYDYAVRCVSGR